MSETLTLTPAIIAAVAKAATLELKEADLALEEDALTEEHRRLDALDRHNAATLPIHERGPAIADAVEVYTAWSHRLQAEQRRVARAAADAAAAVEALLPEGFDLDDAFDAVEAVEAVADEIEETP